MGLQDALPSRSGDLLAGKYRLESKLGSGGMGDVYRATNELIGRSVAIKVLRPEHATSPEIAERFMREARAANLVRHPHVVDVLDYGRDEHGTAYLVQELLSGEDLGAYLQARGGRTTVVDALQILLPIVDAVALAHANGVVHRDLKPANLYLAVAPDGRRVPKILDFGISKISSLQGRIDVSTMSVTLGTPAYMSPEQIQGDAVDQRSDVWAIGVILHEAIAGALPFRGDTPGKQYVQICTADPIALSVAAPDAPAELEQIVRRCLARDLDQRYPSAGALRADLAAFASRHGVDFRAEPLMPDVSGQLARMSAEIRQNEGETSDASVAQSSPVSRRTPRSRWIIAAVALAAAGGITVWAVRPRATIARREARVAPTTTERAAGPASVPVVPAAPTAVVVQPNVAISNVAISNVAPPAAPPVVATQPESHRPTPTVVNMRPDAGHLPNRAGGSHGGHPVNPHHEWGVTTRFK